MAAGYETGEAKEAGGTDCKIGVGSIMTVNVDTSPEKYIDRLIDKLKKKHVLLRSILSLTQAQSSQINEDSIEELQKLIDEKQHVIDDINKLDEEFSVYFSRLKTTLKINSLDELNAAGVEGTRHLKEITAGIINLITEISEIEKANDDKSKEVLGKLGGEIKKLNLGKKVNTMYASKPANTASYFIDKKK